MIPNAKEVLRETLQSLPPPDRPKTLRELIADNLDVILPALEQRSVDEIAAILTAKGIKISGSTLKNYVRQAKEHRPQ